MFTRPRPIADSRSAPRSLLVVSISRTGFAARPALRIVHPSCPDGYGIWEMSADSVAAWGMRASSAKQGRSSMRDKRALISTSELAALLSDPSLRIYRLYNQDRAAAAGQRRAVCRGTRAARVRGGPHSRRGLPRHPGRVFRPGDQAALHDAADPAARCSGGMAWGRAPTWCCTAAAPCGCRRASGGCCGRSGSTRQCWKAASRSSEPRGGLPRAASPRAIRPPPSSPRRDLACSSTRPLSSVRSASPTL